MRLEPCHAMPSDNRQDRFDSTGDGPCADGVFRLRTLIANVFVVADQSSGTWALVDAGVSGSAARIRAFAANVAGTSPPSAILLTHGHFDHRGSLEALLRTWDVPVYAHPLEFPYLTGRQSYPPPDPSVGGGMMAELAFLYPRRPINLGARLLTLPPDGSIPAMPGWQWVHTPGHTAGHVAFVRPDDRVVIAGDAVVTTRQESASSVLTEREELRPPPAYFTTDWTAAESSVRILANLAPDVLATGHGRVLRGPTMRRALHELARDFRSHMPRTGWYVAHGGAGDTALAEGAASELERKNRRRLALAAAAGTAVLAVAAGAAGRGRTRSFRRRG